MITKERQKELLDYYPNGEAMGKAVVLNFIRTLEQMRGLQKGPFLEWDDIEFFRSYLNTQSQEQRDNYNVYANFYEALGDIVNAISLYKQAFAHGTCNAMNILNTAKLSFEALSLLPDNVISDKAAKNIKEAAESSIPVIEKELKHIFMELITSSMIALNIYDYALELCGERMGFDLSNIRSNPIKTDCNIVLAAVAEVKEELTRYLFLSKRGEISPKFQVNVTEEALNKLTEYSKMRFTNTKLKGETKKQIKKIITTMELRHGIIVPLGLNVMAAQKAAGVNV